MPYILAMAKLLRDLKAMENGPVAMLAVTPNRRTLTLVRTPVVVTCKLPRDLGDRLRLRTCLLINSRKSRTLVSRPSETLVLSETVTIIAKMNLNLRLAEVVGTLILWLLRMRSRSALLVVLSRCLKRVTRRRAQALLVLAT